MQSLNKISEISGFTTAQILGRRGSVELKQLRKIVMYFLNKKDGLNQTEIAELFNRHPSVVSTALKDVKDMNIDFYRNALA